MIQKMNSHDSCLSVYSHWAELTVSESFPALGLTRTQDPMCFKCNALQVASAYGSPRGDNSAVGAICAS